MVFRHICRICNSRIEPAPELPPPTRWLWVHTAPELDDDHTPEPIEA